MEWHEGDGLTLGVPVTEAAYRDTFCNCTSRRKLHVQAMEN